MNNVVMTSGTGPNFDLTKNERTLLVFRPTAITVHETTPLTYNITITSKDNATAFSREFFALGNDRQLEIISTNTTRVSVYGPDFSDPITGTYHAQGNFLKPNTEYKITAEITSIGSQIPQNTINDTSVMKVSS
jgi:hypothetical protein